MQRHTLLFVGAVAVPSALLLLLGVHAVRQERELAEKHTSEDGRRAVSLVQQELLNHLGDIALRAERGDITPQSREVALVARVRSGRLVLPWEGDDRAARPDAAFDSALQLASEQLHKLHDPEGALARINAATRKTSSPVDKARANLFVVACLAQMGDRGGARDAARQMLHVSPAVTDEYGIPYLFYAAVRLRVDATAEDEEKILSALSLTFDRTWLCPKATYMAADVLAAVRTSQSAAIRERAATLLAHAERSIRELEQLSGLAAAVPVMENAAEGTWILPGNSTWMLGLGGRRGEPERTLVAARTRDVLSAVRLPDGMLWGRAGEGEGEAVSDRLPGLKVAGQPAAYPDRTGWRQAFYLAALLVVLLVAAFSAWLLNRDVERERNVAALRAQFVSSISHELRTPISTIRTCAELLEMGRVGNERQAAEYLNAIIGESERLNRMVGSVLTFAQMEQGARVYDFRNVSLEEVLRSAVQELDYQLSQKGFLVRTTADAGMHSVRADAVALQEAVVNLLTNAMKYSGSRREIDLGLHRIGGHVVIRVRDYGIGIAPEHHGRIFQGFYRAPQRDAREIPGTGLGLTIVEQVAKAHAGQVMVESQPGQGSTFSISLPASEET